MKFILSIILMASSFIAISQELEYGFDDKNYMNGYNIKKYSDFLFAARQWKPKEQYKEGVSYYKGRGDGYDDIAKAHILFTLASNKGHTYSSVYLGMIFESGKLGDIDYKLAEKYYLRAANKGYKEAMKKLAYWYADGIEIDGKRIIEANPKLSDQLLKKSK